MSLTSKQIDELRAYAKDRKGELAKLINDAADTIEILSAKLHASQMERSSQYYHGGWIPTYEHGFPSEAEQVLVSDGKYVWIDESVYNDVGLMWAGDGADCWERTAWMPLPEPYRGEGD